MEERRNFNSEYLPISVEPKLRKRALKFMNDLIILLEENNHCIKFEYERCHIEMYGQLTEINLRQKYFRKRIKDSSGYGTDTYEKSNKLEFQVGSYARKGWIDIKTKTLESYLTVIYDYIERDSKQWAELRRKQRIEKKEKEIKDQIEAIKIEIITRENAKLDKLIKDANSYKRALTIREYLEAYKAKMKLNDSFNTISNQDFLKWANNRVDEIDPLKI